MRAFEDEMRIGGGSEGLGSVSHAICDDALQRKQAGYGSGVSRLV